MNVERKENYSQVCVWPATLVNGQIQEFEQFFKEEFNARVQYLEEVQTSPDVKNGFIVPESGGRNDVLFAVHKDDVGHFAVPRLKAGIRWIEDVLDNETNRSPNYSIYPERLKDYRTW